MINLERPRSTARFVLLGTRRSIEQMRRMLEALPEAGAVQVLWAGAPSDRSGVLEDRLRRTLETHPDLMVLLSLPAAMEREIHRVSRQLDAQGVRWRWIPTWADQLAGKSGRPRRPASCSSGGINRATFAATDADADLDPLALIGRKPTPLDRPAIDATLRGRVVMITGAGGSIGSELARRACEFKPRTLLLVERTENALFEIDRELQQRCPDQARVALLHDVTDASGTLALAKARRPEVIFHAAAHKHVPMMEEHPAQAVENNFYGARSVADAASEVGAERFIMISTDKAVNPSSVMGATKRLAELYVQDLNRRSPTRFGMVRFGNVLGSACSVLPIWTRQLAEGGPLTVTDPRMTRYFMTIPEAAGLVLQAGAYLSVAGGEVFLLDMGDPIRVVDLARRFVRSHGLEPDVDVSITFTGARPGEKLFEELAYDSEAIEPTAHPAIHLWRTTPPDAARITRVLTTFDRLRARVDPAGHLWAHADRRAVIRAIRDAVPEMVDSVSAHAGQQAGEAETEPPDSMAA